MKINFPLTYTTTNYEILAEIGYEEEKPEYLVYLEAVSETQSDVINYLHQKLLSKFPISTAKNIILELQSLLLIDDDHNLTDAGREALRTGTIFEPLKGVYNIEIAKHTPLVSTVISLSQDKLKGNDAPVDPVIFSEVNKPITLLDNETIRILSVEKNGRKSNNTSKLELQLVFERNTWLVFAKLGRNRQKMELSNNFQSLQLEDTILAELDRVPGSPETIYVRLNSLSDQELSSFTGRRTLSKFKLPHYNVTTTVEITGLNFLPYEDEAYQWAKRLFLLKYLNNYQTESEMIATWQYMIHEVSQFTSYSLPTPTVDELLAEIDNFQQRWHLQAPLDFHLEEVL